MSFPCENEKDLQSLAHWAIDVLGCRAPVPAIRSSSTSEKYCKFASRMLLARGSATGALAPSSCRASLRPRSVESSGY